MMLNRNQIAEKGLISADSTPISFRDVGYDLRIATLISKTPDGRSEKRVDEYYLEPQGVALVVSKESVKLPPDVCAHASVKTSLCRQGVLAINIGIIDPGWEGPISSVLLNFGKERYRLKNDEPFLRLTFHTLEVPTNPSAVTPVDRTVYESEVRQKFDERLAGTFLNFAAAAEEASQKFRSDMKRALVYYIPIAGLALTGMAFLLNFALLAVVSRQMPFDALQTRAQALSEAINRQADDLRTENEDLKRQLNALKLEVDTLSKKK